MVDVSSEERIAWVAMPAINRHRPVQAHKDLAIAHHRGPAIVPPLNRERIAVAFQVDDGALDNWHDRPLSFRSAVPGAYSESDAESRARPGDRQGTRRRTARSLCPAPGPISSCTARVAQRRFGDASVKTCERDLGGPAHLVRNTEENARVPNFLSYSSVRKGGRTAMRACETGLGLDLPRVPEAKSVLLVLVARDGPESHTRATSWRRKGTPVPRSHFTVILAPCHVFEVVGARKTDIMD